VLYSVEIAIQQDCNPARKNDIYFVALWDLPSYVWTPLSRDATGVCFFWRVYFPSRGAVEQENNLRRHPTLLHNK